MNNDLKSLKDITDPISEDIKLFETEFKQALRSEVKLVNTVANYILRNKGKHIRPVLTILSARVCGEPSLNSYKSAAMIELLHIATLIHDDVVDDATARRGFPSINRIWKNKVAVLMGDYILSKALINLVGIKDFEALDLISQTAEKLSSGEILQIEKSLTRSMTEKVYYDMINKKTASLISTSCELGAITSSANTNDRNKMRLFGEKLGMAFQIKDDLFDMLGVQSKTGKNVGADVKKNMITLPLIYSYSNLKKVESRIVKKILNIKNKSKNDIRKLNELIHSSGGFEYAKQKIDEFSNHAIEALNDYPDTVYKQSLIDLVIFNSRRSY
ncbi:MAG: polyprenyl synthetase family protein [Candidatus Neomarinimicrobiota bacterium]|nr:polyprenyl synthetase family protein [Candidatus Neomarinimicrobiota bacterium]